MHKMNAVMTNEIQHPAELTSRMARGDMQAFGELVSAYQQQVLNLAYRLLGDATTAEDIAQDVFVRAYKSAGSFRGQSQLSTWLYRITVNLVLNYRRKRKWETLFAFAGAELRTGEWPASNNRPDREAEQREREDIIQRALRRLPDGQRIVLVLHRWEGYSYKEIAEITGQTVGAVESKIHRAYKRLAKILPQMLEKNEI